MINILHAEANKGVVITYSLPPTANTKSRAAELKENAGKKSAKPTVEARIKSIARDITERKRKFNAREEDEEEGDEEEEEGGDGDEEEEEGGDGDEERENDEGGSYIDQLDNDNSRPNFLNDLKNVLKLWKGDLYGMKRNLEKLVGKFCSNLPCLARSGLELLFDPISNCRPCSL